jgi:hypothetical protein
MTDASRVSSSDVGPSAGDPGEAGRIVAGPKAELEVGRTVEASPDQGDNELATSAAVLAGESGSYFSDLRLVDDPPAAAGDGGSAASGEDWTALPEIEPLPGLESETDEEQFLFLCPHGHKLHGLKRLAGKVGKCPHCESKFEIPSPDDIDDEEQDRDGLDDTVTEDPLGDYGDQDPFGSAPDRSAFGPEHHESSSGAPESTHKPIEPAAYPDAGSSVLRRIVGRLGKSKKPIAQSTVAPPTFAQSPLAPSPSSNPPPLPAKAPAPAQPMRRNPPHPLAQLVARLWAEREHGGVIELHLSGGAMLVPEWFDEKHSRSTHGLFAAQAADGTVTMTVVPWDEVTRVVVRGVEGLPDGMFE